MSYPLTFEPVYKKYLWGGDKIPRHFQRPLPPGIYAESWEVCEHDDGMSVVTNGPWKGRTLRDLVQSDGPALVGGGAEGTDRFPLLIKIIDAKQKLSVQVHPNEETAALTGGEPKTEMWVALAGCDETAEVIAGFPKGVGPAELEQAVAKGEFDRVLNTLPLHPGDAIFMPGGRVHAIGAGCLVLEIQQNANTTYRLHDWNRVDDQGRPRELHLEQALRVIDWDDHGDSRLESSPLPSDAGLMRELVVDCSFFRVERWCASSPQTLSSDGHSFRVLFCEEGMATVTGQGEEVLLTPGDTVLLPADLKTTDVAPWPDGVRLIAISR